MFNKEENIPWIVTGSIAGVILLFVLVACLITAIHRIQEGHVGVYFKNGALLESVTDPGIHWSQPFVTRVEQIKVRPETKYLDPMICTTQDGVRNVFRDVQVISSIDKTQVYELDVPQKVKRFSWYMFHCFLGLAFGSLVWDEDERYSHL